MFDFVTRIAYPMTDGADKVMEPGEFHLKVESLIRAKTLPDLSKKARLRGFSLARR